MSGASLRLGLILPFTPSLLIQCPPNASCARKLLPLLLSEIASSAIDAAALGSRTSPLWRIAARRSVTPQALFRCFRTSGNLDSLRWLMAIASSSMGLPYTFAGFLKLQHVPVGHMLPGERSSMSSSALRSLAL